MFLDQLHQQAINNPVKKRILFPEVMDERIVSAVISIAEEGIATPILVGHPKKLEETLSKLQKTLPLGVEFVDSSDLSAQEPYAQKYFQMRQHKGVVLEQARFTLHNPTYFAMMMLEEGRADGLVSGAHSSLTKPLKPAFQIIRPREGVNKVSSFFLMIPGQTHPDFPTENLSLSRGNGNPASFPSREGTSSALAEDRGVFVYADCAINIDPTSEDLAEIAILTHDSVKKLGIEPKLAMLSFSTYGSAVHENVDKVRIAREMINEKRPDILCAGEIQFDAAIIPEIAKSKIPHSAFTHLQSSLPANTFIFPDLQSGNISYKITERLAGYRAIGPIMQGLNKPVNDLSRGCNIEDIIDVALLTALQ